MFLFLICGSFNLLRLVYYIRGKLSGGQLSGGQFVGGQLSEYPVYHVQSLSDVLGWIGGASTSQLLTGLDRLSTSTSQAITNKKSMNVIAEFACLKSNQRTGLDR